MEDKKTTTYDLAQRILDKIRFLEESFKAITKVHHADEKALDLNLYFFSGAAELLRDLALQMNELAGKLPVEKED